MISGPIIVTGSSGYVAENLIPKLREKYRVIGVDLRPSPYTDVVSDVGGSRFIKLLRSLVREKLTIINLAAARFDFGANAGNYYDQNVSCHLKMLSALESVTVEMFIHMSSVASFSGASIAYSDELSCDDAYRATKALQERAVKEWCLNNNVKYCGLHPSAIFSTDARSDTNIGKLQTVSKFIPLAPKINIKKSLTFLPHISSFIDGVLAGGISPGSYLTIEEPVLTVSEIIQNVASRPVRLVYVPFLFTILKIASYLLYALGLFGRFDLKLTPNRVVKLFSDTSFDSVVLTDVDNVTYVTHSAQRLPEILVKLHGK